MSNIIAKVGDKFILGGVKCVAVEARQDAVLGKVCSGCILEGEDIFEGLAAPDCYDNVIFVEEKNNE